MRQQYQSYHVIQCSLAGMQWRFRGSVKLTIIENGDVDVQATGSHEVGFGLSRPALSSDCNHASTPNPVCPFTLF